MMPSPFRAAWSSAALLATVALAACGGSDTLGPPDGAGCTVGSIAAGDSVSGAVGSASCQTFDPKDYVVSNSASWTLAMKKNQAYVVRMYHDSTGAAGDNLNAYLEAFGRGTHGEPTMVSAYWGSFGLTNGNGGQNYEMFLVADRDRSISLRVQTLSAADTGLYSLVVESCPVTVLSDTLSHTGIDLTNGCISQSFDVMPVRRTFMVFSSDSSTSAEVDFTRTAGTGLFATTLAGPVPDVNCPGDNCWNDDNDNASRSNGYDSTAVLTTTFNYPGRMAASAVIDAQFAAIISVAAHFTKPATVAGRTR